MMKTIVSIASIVLMILIGCSDYPTEMNEGAAQSIMLNIRVKQALGKSTVEMPSVTRARMLIRNIRFKTESEDSVEFKSRPFVADLNLNGAPVTVAVEQVPAGSYDRIEFRIHRLDPDDPEDKPYVNEPQFADFMAGDRYNTIIEGQVTDQSNAEQNFIFRSRDNETQRHFIIPSLQVAPDTKQVEVNLVIEMSRWFVDENGQFLDPGDPRNEDEISDNIKQSIKLE